MFINSQQVYSPSRIGVIALFAVIAYGHAAAAADTEPPRYPTIPAPLAEVAPPYSPERLELRRNYGLMGAGLGIFGGTYTMTAISAYAADQGLLAIPVAGPIIFAAQHLQQKDSSDRAATGFLVMDSMAQASGIVLTLVGALTKRTVKVRDRLIVTPLAGLGAAGLIASGHF